MKNILSFIFILFGVLSCSSDDSGKQEPDPDPIVEEPTQEVINLVVAHRGAWKEFDLPDNSVASLVKAVEIGSDASECDVQVTKDAQVIVYHDETLGGEFIKDLTYEQVAGFSLSNGEQIPLLSDFLEVVLENDFQLWLDIKSLSDDAGGNNQPIRAGQEAAKVIRELGAEKNVSYIIGRKAVLDGSLVAVRGDWESAYMNTQFSPEQFVEQGYPWANFTYSPFLNQPSKIQAYLDKGIKMSIYTVDQEDAMRWFLEQENLYAISTNYPEMLLSLREDMN